MYNPKVFKKKVDMTSELILKTPILMLVYVTLLEVIWMNLSTTNLEGGQVFILDGWMDG